MHHCHCARCRKAHGAAFATYGGAAAEGFRLRGGEGVARFESSPGFFRCFCERCGSVVPGDAVEGRVFVPAGCLDDDPGERPLAHIFAASKPSWYEIPDALPRFDAFPPEVDAPVLPDVAPRDPEGAPRGSCLCSEVGWVVEGAPIVARHCHCSRCRKQRSAAHASNLVTAAGGVRFTRGEDLLASYRVPEAKHFTHSFCRACGGSLPRIDPGRGIAIVPMGSLDDDPGIRPQQHIFVGSKAPWFEIADDLPRHLEFPPG
jgi:hypothetical protein